MAATLEHLLEALATFEGRWCVLRLRDRATGLLAESSGKLERVELGVDDDGEQHVAVTVGRTRFFAHVGEAETGERDRVVVVALAPGISLEVFALPGADGEGRLPGTGEEG